jgi:ribosome-binding factor A
MSHRVERFSSTLKHCLADILMNEIDNPHLKNIIISDVITTPDLKKTRIFISSSVDDVKTLLPQLTKAKGYIKRLLARRMYVKYVPDLIFQEDEVIAASLETSSKMENEEDRDSFDSPGQMKGNEIDGTNLHRGNVPSGKVNPGEDDEEIC